ncbi:lymphocyte antigen 86 isoform X2 [Rhinolophus sinicus]|uniref:lymphocyte antigen 86 isoform X2 n=1 Tax=Rhinolophus sinicus TaxID=89399 RepID=UPI003D7A8D97
MWPCEGKATAEAPCGTEDTGDVRQSLRCPRSQPLHHKTDPLQDFGLSVEQCSKYLKPNLNIRFGIILREDIKELFLDVNLLTKGASILSYSYAVCEEDLPKFSFCGRRKGVAGSMLPKPISFLKNFLRPASSHCSAALESGGLSPGWWFSNLTLPQPHLDTLFNHRLVDPAPVCNSVPLERSLRISFLTSPQVRLMMLGQRPHSENH